MARYVLSDEELENGLITLSDWTVVDGKLHKQFKFGSFAEAMGWMVTVGIHADKMDHHPEWTNVYNKVTVNLVTHDLGNKISSWDIELAQKMDALA